MRGFVMPCGASMTSAAEHAEYKQAHRAMATSLGFEGHMTLADAMT